MAKPPAFQFYPKDYLSDEDVAVMTLEEEGAYIRALCHCWLEGSLPADPKRLRMLLKGCSAETAACVAAKFVISEQDLSRMLHPRLEAEREKQRIWREKSSEGGKKSAQSKGGLRVVEGCLTNGSSKTPGVH